MNILGFTPTDSALTAMGLNIAQIISDYIFLQTPVGALAFAIGFLLSLARLIKDKNKTAVVQFFFLFLTVAFLLLPKTEEGLFVSAQERYGQTAVKAGDLKSSILNFQSNPLLLSYINRGVDLLMIGLFNALDQFALEGSKFLYDPLLDHRICLNVNQSIALGIEDYKLRCSLNRFLSDFYLPVLTQLNPNHLISYWPGDPQVIKHYSKLGISSWKQLDSQLKAYINSHPFLNKEIQKKIGVLTRFPESDVETSLEKSLIESELTHVQGIPLWQKISSWVITNYFLIYGSLMFLFCIAYPFVVIALYLKPSLIFIQNYLKMFLWVKSLILCSALSFYVSILFTRLQNQGSSPAWAWEQPYSCLMAAILLTISPVVSFIFIQKIGGHA